MKGAKGTSAVHLTDGENKHVVGLKDLRVHISPDGKAWFAQGLEIDYAACGNTIEETKHNFEIGLTLTIKEHLKMHGSIDRLLEIASREAWKDFLEASGRSLKLSFSMLDFHDLAPDQQAILADKLPGKIAFVVPEPVHAMA